MSSPSRAGTGYARAAVWLRAHPLAFDAGLALGALVCMVAGSFAHTGGSEGPAFGHRSPQFHTFVLMGVGAAALVLRRRTPMAVLAVTCGVTAVQLISGEPPTLVAMSAVIALCTVAARTDRPTTWRVGLVTMAVLTGTAMCFSETPWYSQENLGIFAWTGMASAAGDAVRSRRAFVDAIRERAERAERTRDEEARRRVAEERLRIARDLHDVVAHHIALVNVQAGVAAHVMDKRPDQAKEALAHVREASRSALNELRATVGLLRQSGDPEAPTEPAPGLAVLDELVGTFRNAGLPVEVACNHEEAGMPAAVDLAAYRIIQEALTNVRKHAGPGAKAEVSVVRVGPAVEVTVLDNGVGQGPASRPEDTAPGTAADGGGHGLIGMRERAAALRGSCTAGPRYGGGFRVQAILPVNAGAGEDA
ncbi:sensor histidine kinase [Streptomyces sp. NBC_01387]|uniref:sensor histidine kinase n=1 Tax=unclassified Streptomyces TaxID=2593676 RepID=UPI00202457A4|nr:MULTISPECIES: sensor histidine kinase [unclassified Streptomyces]MCX4551561.1 sensor histidine kinase [Streptomyces sp. NBC_01500]WSC22945.1 sensor histidine kinase [Streptomyces sp. NBC_01766]WSV56856.1 sensor histidine kinase [Streptomyces sp. NBC_01014]